MPVVPMNPAAAAGGRTKPGPSRRSIADTRPAPAEPFALMAAAQMHSEGRLIPDSPLPPQLGGKDLA